jgi:hypothetical protein
MQQIKADLIREASARLVWIGALISERFQVREPRRSRTAPIIADPIREASYQSMKSVSPSFRRRTQSATDDTDATDQG